MPERGAQAEEAVIADTETSISCTAVEEVIAVVMHKIRQNQLITPFCERLSSFLIGLFNSHYLCRGEAFGQNFFVSLLIPIKPEVKERVEPEIIFCPFAAEFCNFG